MLNLNKTYVIDIETSALLEEMLDHTQFPYKLKPEARLWCIAITNVGTGAVHKAANEEITKGWLQAVLTDCEVLIAHNGLKFDFPALRLFGVFDYEVAWPEEKKSKIFGKEVTIVDTLVWSRLFNPDRPSGHSLEAHGERLGQPKTDWRAEAVKLGLIQYGDPQGAEFRQYHPRMMDYCVQDTKVNRELFLDLLTEVEEYPKWSQAIRLETKLADLAINRESLGFYFHKDKAEAAVKDLDDKLAEIAAKINPILPPRPMNKGELADWTPPKQQLKADGSPTASMIRFANRVGMELWEFGDWYLGTHQLPLPEEPIKTELPSTIDDTDWVKMYLLELGWEPSEWKERDLTKNAKKQSIPLEKRKAALYRWYQDTVGGKYRDHRLKQINTSEDRVLQFLERKLAGEWPVRVPTSPCVRVGVEKDLCPNLLELGESVDFAKDFALYATYKHRRACIAGGVIDDDGNPTKGYLSSYREEDGRISTPAIEIGASTNRYRHIGVANVPRATSDYGAEMRALFGCGDGFLQFGFDFASLEARIEGHYVFPYEGGPELAEQLLAEKPNDLHTKTAERLGISRPSAKSVNYAALYGAQAKKFMKMLNVDFDRASEIFNGFWDGVPPLKQLRDDITFSWMRDTGEEYLLGIDGRKIRTRSKHSLLNALFQSAGVIAAKYTTVYLFQMLQEAGYCISPFNGKPDVCSMIEYHDEVQLAIKPSLAKFKTFASKEEAEEFVSNWKGDQLSAISEGTKWYVVEPNDVSIFIGKAIDKTVEQLGLNVPLGYEWVVNKDWYGCH